MIVIALFVSSGKIKPPGNSQRQETAFTNITPAEFDAILKTKDPFVVDVHIPEQEHLPGTDAFIPYNEVSHRISEFPKDKHAEIIVYCRTDSMSQKAAQILAEEGYTNVKNLKGGVQAYQQSHQKVEITPSLQQLGTVIYGEIAKTEFTLRNNTATPLDVVQISTSCFCTKAELEKTQLDPYESTTIKVSFNPAVHKDDTDLGEVERTIYIDTNNSNFRRLTVSIQATVIKPR